MVNFTTTLYYIALSFSVLCIQTLLKRDYTKRCQAQKYTYFLFAKS